MAVLGGVPGPQIQFATGCFLMFGEIGGRELSVERKSSKLTGASCRVLRRSEVAPDEVVVAIYRPPRTAQSAGVIQHLRKEGSIPVPQRSHRPREVGLIPQLDQPSDGVGDTAIEIESVFRHG